MGAQNFTAAGLESLVNDFQKGALLGQKVALNLWYFDTRPNYVNKENIFFFEFDEPNMIDLQMLGNIFLRIWPGVDVPKI